MHFDKAYVISLEESEKRRKKFFSYAEKAGVDVEWFRAIRGDKVDVEEQQKQGVLSVPFTLKMPGSLGCLLSHTATWDRVKELGDDAVGLIFEDDAVFSPNFKKRLEAISWEDIPEDWDMLWLGWHKINCEPVNRWVGRPRFPSKKRGNSGHYCYLVRGGSVDKLKALLYPTTNKSSKDVVLRGRFDQFNAYFLLRRIARTPIIEFNSIRKLVNNPTSKNGAVRLFKSLFKR